ncbi:hypothetical protein [Actinomadura livida]|uniref:Uncharacterized protein n=1 Tax=Actinomadura livida TaxID=79909 RepID=A0A7W7MUS4_9ACTN|nr:MULTISPECIES: hypothetical protein [Actinomadura]MBB4771848.1 hypothetical protein [Actinomadura catellatispora]GGU02846.1 hypothetical protein GCM10010208_28720 [Actinomadura livida]
MGEGAPSGLMWTTRTDFAVSELKAAGERADQSTGSGVPSIRSETADSLSAGPITAKCRLLCQPRISTVTTYLGHAEDVMEALRSMETTSGHNVW